MIMIGVAQDIPRKTVGQDRPRKREKEGKNRKRKKEKRILTSLVVLLSVGF